MMSENSNMLHRSRLRESEYVLHIKDTALNLCNWVALTTNEKNTIHVYKSLSLMMQRLYSMLTKVDSKGHDDP